MKLINNSKSRVVKFYFNVTGRRMGEARNFFHFIFKIQQNFLINEKKNIVYAFGLG